MAEVTAPRRRGSLRLRITAAATAVVAAALIVGALVFVLVLHASLLDGLRISTERDASELATQIEEFGTGDLQDDGDDDEFYQVLSAPGRVLAASENASGLDALVSPDSDSDSVVVTLPDEDYDFVAVTESADHDESGPDSGGEDAEVTVVAGRSVEEVEESVGTVVPLLAIAVPLLIVLVAATTWWVVGRALRPVERLRREVDEITATNLHNRVADSGTDDEVGRLAATMNRMLHRLDESQTAQRRFISDASHELKSPLASLRQYAEVARAYPDRMGAAELSDAVLDEGARLERLVQSMLLLAHADEQSLGIRGSTVDLDDLALGEANRLKASTPLAVGTAGIGPARVRGDGSLLAQVVRNLADNAARHATGTVQLTVTTHNESAILVIEDDGAGIEPAERERVFERFVRLDDSRARDSGGSGLGLAIVREIIIAHGGSVQVTDGSLGGARIEVRLPAASDS